jgi:hypothetical protein
VKQNLGKRELAALERLLINTIRNVEEQPIIADNVKTAKAYREAHVLFPMRDMLAIIETAIARSPPKAAKKAPAWMWRK